MYRREQVAKSAIIQKSTTQRATQNKNKLRQEGEGRGGSGRSTTEFARNWHGLNVFRVRKKNKSASSGNESEEWLMMGEGGVEIISINLFI